MAKTKIIFNNTEYSIDESTLASAKTQLQSHLLTTMNGSGATINLGGVAYNVDSAKLSTATSNFISHLGTISGNGSKLVVNGVEYSVDANKIQNAISELGSAWGELNNPTEIGDVAILDEAILDYAVLE